MEVVEIEIDENGRIVRPVGVTLRVPSTWLLPDKPTEPEEERAERIEKFWAEHKAILEDLPVNPWPENDPIVDKFKRKGLIS